MIQIRVPSKSHLFFLALIIIFAIYGLWLRLLPMDYLIGGPVQKVIFMDPWYSMRQIEVIVANNLSYPWFDPMTTYPAGKEIDWGPLYPVFSAAVALALGATTRPALMTVVSWIPPLLSLVMIPIMFYTGKRLLDWKAGVIAAVLISVISGEYLYRGFFGYLDHHLTEVIFSTLFMVLYLNCIHTIRSNNPEHHWKNKKLIILSFFCGIIYYLGIMNIPTIFLFAGIAGLFCILHAIISLDEHSLSGFTVTHSIIFGIFTVLFGLTGIHQAGLGIEQYTPIHLFIGVMLIAEPAILLMIIRAMRDRPHWQTRCIIVGMPVVLGIVASIVIPEIISKFNKAIWFFFVYSYQNTYINEIQMWSIARAWNSFNLAFILMIIGIIVAMYKIVKHYDPILMCTLIWGLIILFSTVLHLRFEYYATVIVVLFTAYVLSLLSEMIQDKIHSKKGPRTSRNEGRVKQTENIIGKNVSVIIIGVFILLITVLSSQIIWIVATEQLPVISMSNEWADSLVWLEQHSPDPGVDYLKMYDKENFSYPASSYGVLAWWDYGHWITYVAKRIPISSPFQNNAKVVAKFLISSDEKNAETITDSIKARYIITDYLTVTDNFQAVALWAEGTHDNRSYQKTYYQQSNSNPGRLEPIITLHDNYFQSVASRLHIFDGSKTESVGADLIEFNQPINTGNPYPTITRIAHLTPDQAKEGLNSGLLPTNDMVSVQYTHPITTVPALQHYRLVHESPSVAAEDEIARIHSVKIFEHVKGYSIKGNGTIELPLISNTGRTFMYRQDSMNGFFIVPYSTDVSETGVQATGPYRIIQTGETFTVSENQVFLGK